MSVTSTSSTDRVSAVRLNLPYPPSVNRLYRTGRGRIYKSPQYKNWLDEARIAWLQQRTTLPTRYIRGRYTLEAFVWPPDGRHRDLGNLEKCISDFLQSVNVIENDRLSKWIRFEWMEQESTAGVVVTITPYP